MKTLRLSLLVITLCITTCAALWPSAVAASTRTVVAAQQNNSPTIYVPDDDSVAAELTYHWQNPRFSRDERRQIGTIAVFLVVTAAVRALRLLIRTKPRPARAGNGGAL